MNSAARPTRRKNRPVKNKAQRPQKIEAFNFQEGRVLAGKYQVISQLGGGWEGEVYLVRELGTGIRRAAKCFFPHRNSGNKAARAYATKLHHLKDCPIVIGYHTQERFRFQTHEVQMILTDFVEGITLCRFLSKIPGQKLGPISAIQLLYTLASGPVSYTHLTLPTIYSV